MKTLKNPLVPTITNAFDKPSNSQRTASYKWRMLRQSILERDKYTCQSCSLISHSLEVDHIDTDNENNEPANLQTLCSPCHLKKTTIENKRLDSYLAHSERLKLLIAARNLDSPTKYNK